MKKIEITQEINNYLSQNKFYFVDLMNNRIPISSYEEYIETFKLIENTFKDSINEFENEAIKYKNKMVSFVDEILSLEEIDIKNYISNNIKKHIYNDSYTSEKHINTVFISSLNNNLDRSETALKLIYKELGYDNLLYYIELLKNSYILTSYLNDSQKQQVALHYILFKTGHHSSTKLSRNKTSINLYNEMKKNIDDSIKEITNEKEDYINFINDEKNKINEWLEKEKEKQSIKETEYNDFINECKGKMNNLETMYTKKLKIEKPAEFMKEKAEEYLKSSRHWAIATILLIIVLMFILSCLISPKIKVGDKIIEINIFNSEIPIYQSIILLAMVCLIVYVIRVFIKLTISSKHLSEEYKQKYVLTYFYLSLVNEGKLTNELGDTIISKLFTKAETGLIKNEANIEIESIYKTLTGIGK